MVALLLGLRLVGEMLVVPGQHQRIYYRLRDKGKQFGMKGCGLLKRGHDIVKMRSNRFQQFRQHGILDLFDQAEQARQFRADALSRTEPTERRTQV